MNNTRKSISGDTVTESRRLCYSKVVSMPKSRYFNNLYLLATNSLLLLLLRSLQLLVAEGQGLQDPVLQQTLCCCCSDHYSYLWRRDKVFKTQFCNKLFIVVAQISTVTCGEGSRCSRPSSVTNSLLLLFRSVQLLVAEGQGVQDPVLHQTLCCCWSDHYSYLWRRDKVFKTQFCNKRKFKKKQLVVGQIITVTCGGRTRSSRPSSGAWCSSAGSTSIKVPMRRKKGRHTC
jgi:hypothetical protein